MVAVNHKGALEPLCLYFLHVPFMLLVTTEAAHFLTVTSACGVKGESCCSTPSASDQFRSLSLPDIRPGATISTCTQFLLPLPCSSHLTIVDVCLSPFTFSLLLTNCPAFESSFIQILESHGVSLSVALDALPSECQCMDALILGHVDLQGQALSALHKELGGLMDDPCLSLSSSH